MGIKPSKRMDSFTTSIFSELAQLKREKQKLGMEVIDLSVGSPDLPPPQFIMEELAKQVKDPKQYGYTLAGTEEFHQAVSTYYQRRFNVDIEPQKEVVLLMGSQDGLVHLPLFFTDPGDYVLVPDPGYTAYEAGINVASATLFPMPLKEENHFLPCLDDIPEEIAYKAKMMILNFPGNPVPALANKDFFEKVVSFAKKYQILVLHDFAYSELVFDDHQVTSFLEVDGAKEVGIEINSLSKSFNFAGARIGYILGNKEVIEIIKRIKSNLDYGVFLPIQKAAVKALEHDGMFLVENAKIYERRRDILVNGLKELGWNITPSPATMFLWARIPFGWNSKNFAFELLHQTGVVVTPGNAFGEYGEGYVRIALVQDEEKLKKAIEKIKESNILILKN